MSAPIQKMLLYTRRAQPKMPKTRSRSGCTYCKEKKKKCDEKRPQCTRCAERSIQCAYEAIKPRQRRKRDSASLSKTGAARGGYVPASKVDDWQALEWVYRSRVEARLNHKSPSPISYHSIPETYDDPIPSFEPEPEDNQDDLNRELIPWEPDTFYTTEPATARSLPPDLAMISPSPTGSPTLEFSIPAFSEFSDRPNRRALVDHFCNVLSHLIVFREDSGNAFQQLVLPLSHSSSPVMNAIYALSSAHLEHRGVKNVEGSLYFQQQAVQGLTHLIKNQNQKNKNELLAAIILLVYYEVLVQPGRGSIINGHLKGAFAIMCMNRDLSPVGLFLERAFGFYDVIAALSLGTPTVSTAPSAGGLLPVPPPNAPKASDPLTNVDTLLGMANTLWPIMHRLSNLMFTKKELEDAQRMKYISKAAVLRTELDATARAIEAALTRWKPCLPATMSVQDDELVLDGLDRDDERRPEIARLRSILHNALAYRHSALVYLYRTIHGFSPRHGLVQKHAHTSLQHCVKTTVAGGPMSALLWPLFVAACEAISPEDRGLATLAFEEIGDRQGMMNIEDAWVVVQEVWRRIDVLDDGPVMGTDPNLWRQVCAERGITVVFG